MAFRIIAGLGNPGRQYEDTRHNVGFMLLDLLALQERATFQNAPKWQCQLAKLSDGTLLVKPQTFMNLCGRSLRPLMAYYHWDPSEMLVVYDDVALPLETLRFREKGSAGGHNGIKSIIEHFGSDAFPRLKIGIGNCLPGEMVGHVLGKFSPDEGPHLENTLATALAAVQTARSKGLAMAANRFHSRTPPQSHTDESQIPRPDHSEHESPRRNG